MRINTAVCYSFDLNVEDPMAHLRLIGPLGHAGINIINGIENNQININRVSEGDMVILQRHFPNNFESYIKIIELAHKEKKPVIFDLDDLLFYLPKNHPDRKNAIFSPSLLPMFQALMQADLVSVSTSRLKNVLANYNDNLVVLPNYFDDDLWQLKPPALRISEHETITVGYMGGNSHKPDLEYIMPVLLDLIKYYPQKLRFQFWGVQPPVEIASLPQVQWSPTTTYRYKEFAAFFQTQTADIFIAPLIDNLFNRCKSPLKFFEYSAFGVPGVFSRLEPYAGIVTQGHNGLLASSLDEWKNCLVQLIEDDGLRFSIAKEAQETIRSHWLLSRNAYRWEKTYKRALDIQFSNREKNSRIISFVESINLQLIETFNKNEASLAEKETAIQTLTSQIAEKEQTVQALAEQVAEKGQQVQTLAEQLAEKGQQVQAFSAQVEEIRSSTTWSIIQYLWSVRLFLAPNGSKRERFGRFIMKGFRVWRAEGFTTFFRNALLKINNSKKTRQKNSLEDAQRIITPLVKQSTLSTVSDLQQHQNTQHNLVILDNPKRYGADQFLPDRKVKHYDTGVIYHLYYPELWDDILPFLTNLGNEFDLFITIPHNVSISEQHIRECFPAAQVYRCENRGRDVAPFLTVFSAISMFGYKYICKIHAKKSPHLKAGKQWRDDMLSNLLGSQKTIEQIKNAFDQHPSWGLIAPKGHVAPYTYYWSRNESNVRKLSRCIGLSTEQFDFSFVVGSMFWFRPDVFFPLTKMGILTEDFDTEQGQDDGTLAHAFERFFGMLVCNTGYQIAECDSRGVKLTNITSEQADSFTHAYAALSGLITKD